MLIFPSEIPMEFRESRSVFCIQQDQALLGGAAENKVPADAQRFHWASGFDGAFQVSKQLSMLGEE